jgi:DNA-binding response OmpR family regulator
MRSPQLIVYETDRWIADLLRGTAEMWQWTLRELRDEDAFLRAVRQGGPSIVVVEVSHNLDHDLPLIERYRSQSPQAALIAVLGVSQPELLGLVWDLGATYVLAPPTPRDSLLTLVLGLMESAGAER